MSTTTITADALRRYAADPMSFFDDARLIPDGPRFGELMTPEQREVLSVVSRCLLAISRRQHPITRGVWLEAVKGFGKDGLAGIGILWLLVFSPWNVLIQVGADDQEQAGEVKRAIEDWLRANLWLEDRVDVQRWKIIAKRTGAECEILTTDATGSHGARVSFLCLNEVSHIQSEEYASTLMDNFTKMPNAFALLCTNAGFSGSWAWKWRELYREDPRWHFQKVTETPSWQTEADIREAERRNSPSRFRRLYRGEWVSPGGDLLSTAQVEKQIIYDSSLPSDDPQWNIGAIGVDLGLAGHHSAIVALSGSQRERKLRVARVVDIKPPVRLEFVRDTIVRVARQHKIYGVFMDAWQGIRLSEELRDMGFVVVAEHQNGAVLTKQAGALLQCFQDELLYLYKGDEGGDLLIRDLNRARIVEKSYGHKIESDVDEFGHGDRLSALLQCLPAMLEALGKDWPVQEVPYGPPERRSWAKPLDPYWEPLTFN
jgi:hypothetical protein